MGNGGMLAPAITARAHGIIGEPGSLDLRVGRLELKADRLAENLEAVKARLTDVEGTLRQAIDDGDRRVLIDAIGPGWWDYVVAALSLAAAGFALAA